MSNQKKVGVAIDSELVAKLQDLTEKMVALVIEGEQIFVKAGGQTRGQIEDAGETEHLKLVEASAGEIWLEALPVAAQIRKLKKIRKEKILRAYVKDGIFSEQTVGADQVAESILKGENQGFDGYYPIGHLKGMVSALRLILK